MKRLFTIIPVAALLIAGCAKIEDMSIRNLNDTEIAFNTHSSVTKAIVEGTAMVDTMGIYGYVVPGTYSEGGYLMKNAKYDENGNAVDGHYYWPKADNTSIDFIFTAYSQYAEAPTWENDTLKIEIPALSQELINGGDFNDVLWAQTLVNNHQNALSEHTRVNLTFKHALSWLQFKAEVENNAAIKWVKIKSVKFDKYTEGQEYIAPTEGQEYIAPYNDTTDTWVNLKKTNSAVASATKLKGPGETTYTNAAALPDELVDEIKSYYTVDNGDAGDYDLHMGNTVWASNVIKQLRRTDKAIPAAYDLAVEMAGGEIMHFFNGWKYLQDNGYDIQPATTGGKPDVWTYVLIDAFVNGAAYTVVGLNCWDSNAVPQHTIVENPGQPYIAPTAGQEYIAPGYVAEGVYSGGVLALPTNSLLSENPVATYNTQKDTTLNYCTQEWTINTAEQKVLSNALVVPQPVPEYVTVVFDICIENATGDEVIITDRKISRRINTGKDNVNVDYVASWIAANKYIYNFKFDGEEIDFTVTTVAWDSNNTYEYYVWDYTE